jgi:7-keto-8-aminopelargonate synthetase-like enzyme
MRVPFLKPSIEEEDIERMNASIRSGWLTYGPYTREFERKLAAFANMPHVVTTASCTASLHISLILANVSRGDEVITTPLSWVATANVILYQGAKVVFADVDPKTGNLDPVDAERRITHRTKAIIVVHLYGAMADMKSFEALSKKYGLAIIEDAAHALVSLPATASDQVTLGYQRATVSMWPRTLPRLKAVQLPYMTRVMNRLFECFVGTESAIPKTASGECFHLDTSMRGVISRLHFC